MSLDQTQEVPFRRPFYPALNGLRGMAILVVFFDHFLSFVTGLEWLRAGWIGVDVFFVLSGFLITGGLVEDAGRPGFFRVFYTKRALRIFPLYYGFWFLIVLLRVFHAVSLPHLWWMWPIYLGNLRTVHQVEAGQLFSLHLLYLYAGHHVVGVEVNHFWSLCVEEQYYLVWPLVIFLVRNRRRLMVLCVSLCCVSLAARIAIHLLAPESISYREFVSHQTYVRMDGMFMGSFLALWLRSQETSRLSYQKVFRWTATVSLGAWLPYLLFTWCRAFLAHEPLVADLRTKWTSTVGFSLAPLLGMTLVPGCLHPESMIARFFNFRPLRQLGRVSHGFYVIHVMPQQMYLRFLRLHPKPTTGLAVATAWFFVCRVISWLSFEYFEKPFLRLKDRISKESGIPALQTKAESKLSEKPFLGSMQDMR